MSYLDFSFLVIVHKNKLEWCLTYQPQNADYLKKTNTKSFKKNFILEGQLHGQQERGERGK